MLWNVRGTNCRDNVQTFCKYCQVFSPNCFDTWSFVYESQRCKNKYNTRQTVNQSVQHLAEKVRTSQMMCFTGYSHVDGPVAARDGERASSRTGLHLKSIVPRKKSNYKKKR